MKKILIIDDEEIVTKSLQKLLKKNNFEVYTANSGHQALEIAKKEKFDLLITDIRMPGMNGVDTIKNIYKILEKKNKGIIPTIFITGYVNEEIEKTAEELKPVAYIYKPFDINELVEKIKEVLK
jgi:CheY-like chemotaxis protein